MGKLDEKREFIGALKVYLGFILAIMLSVGAGISSLFLKEETSILFYIGSFVLLLLFVVFFTIANKMHKVIKSLKDL